MEQLCLGAVLFVLLTAFLIRRMKPVPSATTWEQVEDEEGAWDTDLAMEDEGW